MSFFILLSHCFNIRLTNNKTIIIICKESQIYVTTFYLISYFFSYKTLKLKNINGIKLKLKRFLIPYIIWPIFIFLFNNILYNYGIYIDHYNIKDLFIQLITGKRIHYVFWFQCNLIFTFILFSIISLKNQNDCLFTMQIFGIAGYFYHSINFHLKLFEDYIFEIKTLIQDFGKVLFYSSIGLTLASLIDINNLKKKRRKKILFSLIGIYLIKDISFIKKNLIDLILIIREIAAISSFILFSMIPDLNNKKIYSIIYQITNYSGGVYYLHTMIWKILQRKMNIFKKRTLNSCFLNYIICYLICFVGEKIFAKSNLKYLFK